MRRKEVKRIIKRFVVKILCIIVIIIMLGILFIAVSLFFYSIIYKDINSNNAKIDVLRNEINLNVTNDYVVDSWNYNVIGLSDIVLYTKDDKHFINLIKFKKIIKGEIFYSQIKAIGTNRMKMQALVPYAEGRIYVRNSYIYVSYIRRSKKIFIQEGYLSGTLLYDSVEENSRYKLRLIYTRQFGLGFGKDKKALIYLRFILMDDYIPTDIAIVELKNEPGNIYMAITFDKYAGENHEAIKTFLKKYFDITVKD